MSTAAFLVAITSFVEDYHKLSARLRILMHFVAASMVVLGCFSLNSLELGNWRIILPEPLGSIFTLLFVVWFTNLYNFMDGMDGFAGGMTVIGFGVYAILGWMSGGHSFAALSAIICASALGFVLFNFPPARIFMGDTGSTTLGFLVASFTLWANEKEIFPLWIGLLVFSPFVIDATLTLVRRLIKGGRFWQPHRSHYYQRLVLAGWGHRRTVLWEYTLMVGCGLSAFIAVRVPIRWHWLIIVAWGTVYGGLVYLCQGFIEGKDQELAIRRR
jgi:UDP-N-acetylmuramyl pentapeptide phosphotransferase/UDP-N-acetylglucosamine-1-phosphate transferase